MAEFDPKNRELCPDGACIGLIGPDGRCRECGTISPSAVSDPRNRGLDLEAGKEGEVPEALANRELCADGACIGLVGDDGRCGECGRTREEIRADGGDDEEEEGEESEGESEEEAAGGPGADGDEPGEDDDDWARRTLCPDDTCVGVLRPDGTCPECGGQAPASNDPS